MDATLRESLRGLLLGAGLAVAALLGVHGSDAEATPIYAISSVNSCDTCHVEPVGWSQPELKDRTCTLSCNACHVSPTGGAMRTSSGTFFAREFLPQFTAGTRPSAKVTTDPLTRLSEGASSEGHFQFGKGFAGWWPGSTRAEDIPDRFGGVDPDPAFKAGGDIRTMAYFPVGGDPAVFPMQADLYLFGRLQKHVALYASVGLSGSRANGDVTDGDGFTYADVSEAIANRELMVKIDRLPYNSYVLAGRFNIPYGWHIPDHTSFVRRDLGLGENRQVFGVMAGTNPNYPFVNVAAFFQGVDFWPGDTTTGLGIADAGYVSANEPGYGVAVSAGVRELGWHVAGSAMAFRSRDGYDQLTFGPQWAVNLYPLTYLGELDMRRDTDPGVSTVALFSYNELDYRIIDPLVAKLKLDWHDADVSILDDHRNRFTAGVEYHPFTSTSVELQYRRNYTGGTVAFVGSTFTGQEVLFMLHGYL